MIVFILSSCLFSTFPYSLGLSSWYRGKVTTIFVPKCSRLVRAIVHDAVQ